MVQTEQKHDVMLHVGHNTSYIQPKASRGSNQRDGRAQIRSNVCLEKIPSASVQRACFCKNTGTNFGENGWETVAKWKSNLEAERKYPSPARSFPYFSSLSPTRREHTGIKGGSSIYLSVSKAAVRFEATLRDKKRGREKKKKVAARRDMRCFYERVFWGIR